MPVDDVVLHEFEDCVCGPLQVPIVREDGSVGWVVVHRALDARD